MNSIQYEEFCRAFLAAKLCLEPEEINSGFLKNPQREGFPGYKHQIDLYWETGSEIGRYLNIANAKLRGSRKVTQPEVLLLEQVRQKVGAHKAYLLTNSGFTMGAEAAAKVLGIALLILRPNFDASSLPSWQDRGLLRKALGRLFDSALDTCYNFAVTVRVMLSG